MVSLFNLKFVGYKDCSFFNIVSKGINFIVEIVSTVGFFRKVFFWLIGTRICDGKVHAMGGAMGGAKSSANHQLKQAKEIHEINL